MDTKVPPLHGQKVFFSGTHIHLRPPCMDHHDDGGGDASHDRGVHNRPSGGASNQSPKTMSQDVSSTMSSFRTDGKLFRQYGLIQAKSGG